MDKDLTEAWSCAANLSLYDEDPGPRETNVGSRREPKIVDRREAQLGVYTRHILVKLDADHDRLIDLRRRCAERSAAARTLGEGWRAVKARRNLPAASSWLTALSALTPRSRREIASLWAIGAELAERAAQMVTEAGADQDPKARARLLASANHTLTFDVIGAMVPADVEQQAAADLAEKLREIDEEDGRAPQS